MENVITRFWNGKSYPMYLKWGVFGIGIVMLFLFVFTVKRIGICGNLVPCLFSLPHYSLRFFIISNLALIFPLSLLTLSLRIEMFLSWWKVTRKGLVVFSLVFLMAVMTPPARGGFFNVDGLQYVPMFLVAGMTVGLSFVFLLKQAFLTYWNKHLPLWVLIVLAILFVTGGFFGGYHLFTLVI